MANLETYLEYIDPQITFWRSGTEDDPYVPRVDSLVVRDNKITLLEIPSYTHRISISGFIEIDQNTYIINNNQLQDDEMIVDYSHGIIQFSPVHEGRSFVCSYYGKGLVLIPASRIYGMVSQNPDVVKTLQDYINEIEVRIAENKESLRRVEEVIIEAKQTINDSIKATDNANIATEKANVATGLALDAYNTTRLVFKEPVNNFSDIPTTYPTPLVGWTVQTTRDGKRYRFDGSRWILIDIFGDNYQIVNENKDGLMSVADYLKLKSFPVGLTNRTIVMSLPDIVQGVVENNFSFPFNGRIIDFYASCVTTGETLTEISVERTRNLTNWTEITNRRLRFQPSSHYDDKQVTFVDNVVQSKDIFRVNMTQQGFGFYNATITFVIETKI